MQQSKLALYALIFYLKKKSKQKKRTPDHLFLFQRWAAVTTDISFEQLLMFIDVYKRPNHWAHDVAATLNQRQWCWYKVAATYCAQWEGLFSIWNYHKYISWLFPLHEEYLWYGSATFLYFCSFGAPKGLIDHYVAIYLLSDIAIWLPCFRHTIWLNPCSWLST